MINSLQNFLTDNEKIISLIQFIFFLVFSVLLYRKTGNINFLKEWLTNMLYRKENYNVENVVDKKSGEILERKTVSAGTCFDNLKPVYRLNETTGELVKTDEFVDIQEIVNSCRANVLQNVLDRFYPVMSTQENGLVAEQVNTQADIDFLQEACETAEEYRKKYGLADDLSFSEIFDVIKSNAENLKKRIEIENKKEITQNEKKETVEKSE